MIKLILDDCMNVMKDYKDNHFDLAIVDPPYSIGADKPSKKPNLCKQKNGNYLKVDAPIYNHKNWDNKIPDRKYFNELLRISKNQIVWGYNHLSELLTCCTAFIFWDKDVSVENYSAGELAYSSFKGVSKKVKIVWDGFRQEDMKSKEKRIHPTQKPVKLYEWLLMNYAKKGDKILDTHLGSGSIAIACHNLGFNLTACELDKEYYESAMKRINNHKSQIRMF